MKGLVYIIDIRPHSLACNRAPTTIPVSDGQKNLALLQQNRYLKGRLYGLAAFDYAGTIMTFPSEFTVASVPIEWMDVIFSGKLEEGGPGEDVTDQVHGSVSADST